jgi:XTP/dITP diphosphohydrolase
MTAEGGCAWHEAQTHESLLPFLIEETAEFVDAVERGLPAEEVAGELGDVLYQVLFHAAIAERNGEGYDLGTVAARLSEKLRARHPHVFGDRGYMSVDELNAEWERLKEDAAGQQRGSRGVLDGIPAGMPTLARSAKVVERLRRAGLLDTDAVVTRAQTDGASTSEELLGDEILSLVMKANATGVDPDRALRLATARLAADYVTPIAQ